MILEDILQIKHSGGHLGQNHANRTFISTGLTSNNEFVMPYNLVDCGWIYMK